MIIGRDRYENTTLTVRGMSCEHCCEAIKKGLKSLAGVVGVEVDLSGNKVEVDFDPSQVSEAGIKQKIMDLGYQVEG